MAMHDGNDGEQGSGGSTQEPGKRKSYFGWLVLLIAVAVLITVLVR